MGGRDHLPRRDGHAYAHQQPDVELVMVCYPSHRMAIDDVANKERRQTCHHLYRQGAEIRMVIHWDHWHDRSTPYGLLCQKHDAYAPWSMYPDSYRRIHYRNHLG